MEDIEDFSSDLLPPVNGVGFPAHGVNQMLIIEKGILGRITVIFVKEKLGF